MSISADQLGNLIKIETTFGEQIVGELYCYEKKSSMVVLNILLMSCVKSKSPSFSEKKIDNSDESDIVMIKEQYIKSVEIIRKGRIEDVVLPRVSSSSIQAKEVRNLNPAMRNRSARKRRCCLDNLPRLLLMETTCLRI